MASDSNSPYGKQTPETRLKAVKEKLRGSENVVPVDKDAIEECVDEADLEPMSKKNYCTCLRVLAQESDEPLSEMSANELNDHVTTVSKRRGWSDNTLTQYQSATKLLAEHLGEDREDISINSTGQGNDIDPRDILTPDEFHDLRQATTNMRDKALVDLLGYTGQRISMIQQLKIEDIDVESGVWYVPESAKGLKGADEVGKKRPLLAARRSVADWIENHPTGNDGDYLLTSLAHISNSESGDMVAKNSLRKALKRTADRADVEKDVNPHAFRHYFVTIAKKRYDMEDSTVKHIIGHGEGSNIMETTYQHLGDDYHIEEAEKAFGMWDESEEEEMAPPVCEDCQRPLRPSAKKCPTPGCDREFGDGADPIRNDGLDEETELLQKAGTLFLSSFAEDSGMDPQEYVNEMVETMAAQTGTDEETAADALRDADPQDIIEQQDDVVAQDSS